MPKFIKYISDSVSPEQIGNKGFVLRELARNNFRVPQTAFLTAEAFAVFLHENSALLKFNELKEQDLSDWRQVVLTGDLPIQLKDELALACQRFRQAGVNTLAVRSSGLLEDSRSDSFAGQYRSELNVPCEPEALEQAVRRVWQSLCSPAALGYFQKKGLDANKAGMAVILQEMIRPDWAGVAFSVHPVSGDPDQMLVEYVAELGDKLMDGQQTPTQVAIQKRDGKIIDRAHFDAPDFLQQLVRKVAQMEQDFGYPVDVEWAVTGDIIYFLQMRAITTVTAPTEQPELWTDENVGEVIPDIVTPLSWSILDGVTNRGFRWFLRRIALRFPVDVKLFDTYKGKVYFNRTAFERLMQRFYLRQAVKENGLAGARVASHLLQMVASFAAILLLNVRLPFKIKRHIKNSDRALTRLRWRADQESSSFGQKIGELIAYQKHTMALHISGTVFAEVFYQLLKKITELWVRPETDLTSDNLLIGASGLVSAQNAQALWRLAKEIRACTACRQILLEAENARQFEERLEREEQGAEILAQWQAYFARYGHGALHEFELYYPRWWEDKSFILHTLKEYVGKGEGAHPLAQHQKKAEQRAQNIGRARAVLSFAKRILFDYLLKKTQFYATHREELKQRLLIAHSELKKYLLAIGREWKSLSAVDQPDDVFFCTWPEIEAVLSVSAQASAWRAAIRERKKQRAAFEQADHPKKLHRIGDRWFPLPGEQGNVVSGLRGIGCSAGTIEGRANVILTPEEFDQMQPGDVLITKATNPGWSPLFLMAGAVVTEIGGALSHAAIIAREYGIPMVAAVPDVCRKVRTGQWVRVNGSQGTVELISQKDN